MRNVLILLTCLILSSCISIERNIFLNRDGSGTEKIIIKIDKSYFKGEYKNTFSKYLPYSPDKDTLRGVLAPKPFEEVYYDSVYKSAIKNLYSADAKNNTTIIDNYEINNLTDSSKQIFLEYRFNDITKLQERFLRMFKEDWDDLQSIIEVAFDNNQETIVFDYKLYSIDRSKHIPSDSTKKIAEERFSELFGSNSFTFKLEVDGKIISTNGEKIDSNSVQWEMPFHKFFLDPLELKTSFE